MFFKRPIFNVQVISFNQLNEDIRNWSLILPKDISIILGMPRSGFTVSHMLAAYMNVECKQFKADCFARQETSRPVKEMEYKPFLVDDCCSYGTTINYCKSQINEKIITGCIYARKKGINKCKLDYWFRKHGEVTTLVVTEWNWFMHQDSFMISISEEVLNFIENISEHISIYKGNIDCLIDQYSKDIEKYLLVVYKQKLAEQIAATVGKPVLSLENFVLYDFTEACWPEKILVIGKEKDNICNYLSFNGWKTEKNVETYKQILTNEVIAGEYVENNINTLLKENENYKIIYSEEEAFKYGN